MSEYRFRPVCWTSKPMLLCLFCVPPPSYKGSWYLSMRNCDCFSTYLLTKCGFLKDKNNVLFLSFYRNLEHCPAFSKKNLSNEQSSTSVVILARELFYIT